jgi:hypothetical protein
MSLNTKTRESHDWQLIEGPTGLLSVKYEQPTHLTRHSRPLPPPEQFVRGRNVHIKPPMGPSAQAFCTCFEAAGMTFLNADFLDDPYDGILEALMDKDVQ